MPNEYNSSGEIILRSTTGTQMSLPRFYQLALVDGNGNYARPTSWRGHNAWDMGVAGATTVPAVTPVFGTVTSCAQTGYNGGMGTFVIIEDEKGQKHRFMHMIENSLVVSTGDSVRQGDKLGIIGNTGDSQGAHLHYDVLVDGSRIPDPIDAFDCTTLPSGWNFGDAVDHGNNWDYIELDKAATDYGPPGGDTPSEPFTTDAICHDISHPQVQDNNGRTIYDLIDALVAENHGGIIVGGGKLENSGFVDWTSKHPDYHADDVMNYAKGKIPMGVYFYNYADFGRDTTNAVAGAVAYLTNAGLTPNDFKMGVWLDIDSEGGGPSGDPHLSNDVGTNMINVRAFIDGFTAAGFATAGIYTTASVLSLGKFECDYSHDIPIWCAYIGSASGSITFDEASLDRITRAYPAVGNYTKVYMHQYTWSERVSGWGNDLDGDKVLQPIPTSGGGSGGGDYTEVIKVTVDVIPPKRIYFDPTPGLIDAATDLLSDREAEIKIITDADNAELYYTTDGSSPYQYTYVNGNLAYTVASNAELCSSSITIHKDTHIRVVAVPTGTGITGSFEEPLAKGSATYLFKYHSLDQSWESEQKSYATSDGDVSFFEENKQAFLRLHAEQTEEEILYSAVYKHDSQVEEDDAKDSASSSGEATPEDERDGRDDVTTSPSVPDEVGYNADEPEGD